MYAHNYGWDIRANIAHARAIVKRAHQLRDNPEKGNTYRKCEPEERAYVKPRARKYPAWKHIARPSAALLLHYTDNRDFVHRAMTSTAWLAAGEPEEKLEEGKVVKLPEPPPKDCMIYAARAPGAVGFHAVMVDDPRFRKETAREVAEWIRDGCEVHRVTREESVTGLREYQNWRKEQAAAAHG